MRDAVDVLDALDARPVVNEQREAMLGEKLPFVELVVVRGGPPRTNEGRLQRPSVRRGLKPVGSVEKRPDLQADTLTTH